MKFHPTITGCFFVANLTSCHFNPTLTSMPTDASKKAPISTKMDVDIPKEEFTPEQLRSIALGLRSTFTDGEQSMPLATIVDAMALEGPVTEVIPGILEAYPNPVQVVCKGNLCSGSSYGTPHSFLATFIKIPVFGTPTISMGSRIEIDFRLSDDGNLIEICRFTGVRAKAGTFGGPIDGFIGEINKDVIKVLKIDIGFGGSYPNGSCKPQ
jgi:hypothetical protein